MAANLTVVQYNPCAAANYNRITDIASELSFSDIVVLNGTAHKGNTLLHDKKHIGQFDLYQYPFLPGPFTNRACGHAIMLKRSRLTPARLDRYYQCPTKSAAAVVA